MKKALVIACMIVGTLSLMAIGLVRHENAKTDMSENQIEKAIESKEEQSIVIDNFAIEVGTRFIANVSKEDLHKAVSISEIIPKSAHSDHYYIKETSVRIDNYDLDTKVTGFDLNLNEPQLALLKRVQYSDNLQFGAQHASSWESGSLNYMVSVVPEQQAEYIDGKDELVSYLREGSSSIATFFKKGQWGAGKINFTIDEQGTISNINLTSTSRNIEVDQQMIRLISDTPGNWIPAENAKGEKVKQVLTLSFGSLGC